MSVIQELNAKMPKRLNVNDSFHQALFGNETFTPAAEIIRSSDYDCGAVANEFEYLRGFMDYIAKSGGADAFKGPYLDLVVKTFTYLKRYYQESDEWLRKRFYAMVRRKKNPRWDTPWSIIDVFSYFFDRSNIYLVENPVQTNLLLNMGLELDDMSMWTLAQTGASTIQRVDENQWQETWCISLVDGGSGEASFSQTCAVAAGANQFGFMLKDDAANTALNVVEARIQRSDGKYWDAVTESWTNTETGVRFKSAIGYRYCSMWALFPTGTDATVSIRTVGTPCSMFVDYLEFGPHPSEPSLRLVVTTYGQSGSFMSFFPEGSDPIGGADYEDVAGYLDNDFIGGSGVGLTTIMFEDLLNKVKPAGVKSSFDIISADL